MRLLRALLVGAGTAVAIAVVTAIVLAVVGIYQSGHGGRAWTDVEAVDRGPFQLSVADVVLLAVALCGAVGGFVAAFAGSGREVQQREQREQDGARGVDREGRRP
jgi:hypothetical protein